MEHADYDEKLSELRLTNLTALMTSRQLNQRGVAEAVGVTPATISQYLNKVMPLGRTFCKKLEKSFELPQGSMDKVDMKFPLPASKPVTQGMVLSIPSLATDIEGLSALQLAVIEAFAKAAKAGAVDDTACLALIARFLKVAADPQIGVSKIGDSAQE